MFSHPETGTTYIILDTHSAVLFMANQWAWGQGLEFFAASRACMQVRDGEAEPEVAREAFVRALMAAGIAERG